MKLKSAFKRMWRVLRVILFFFALIGLGASIIPAVVLIGYHDQIWPVFAYIGLFVLGFIIEHFERKAGWADHYGHWIEK